MRKVSALVLALSLTAAFDAAGQEKKTPKSTASKVDPALVAIEDRPGLPRVLLIGDSISIGYTLPTRKILADTANVHRILTNGGPTTNGLAHLKDWLGDKKWDVIHFNWGLHDLKTMGGKHQVPIEEYEKNLRTLVKQLKATGATLVWASTTPVPDGKLNPPRKSSDVVAYNAVARKVMEENGVDIDDLYEFALPILTKIQRPVNVHFTESGSAILAKPVARSILKALKK